MLKISIWTLRPLPIALKDPHVHCEVFVGDFHR